MQPTGHSRHSPRSRTSSRPASRLSVSLVAPKAPSYSYRAKSSRSKKTFNRGLRGFSRMNALSYPRQSAQSAVKSSLVAAAGCAMSFHCFLPQCPEMSGFVRSSQRSPRFHHQPPVPTRLTAISIVQPTRHTRHPPHTGKTDNIDPTVQIDRPTSGISSPRFVTFGASLLRGESGKLLVISPCSSTLEKKCNCLSHPAPARRELSCFDASGRLRIIGRESTNGTDPRRISRPC